MEHIVQFGINIDDTAIKQTIETQALKAVCDQIRAEAIQSVGFDSEWQWKTKLKEMVNEEIGDFLERNKSLIVDAAATKLADKLSRSKMVREKVGDILEDIL